MGTVVVGEFNRVTLNGGTGTFVDVTAARLGSTVLDWQVVAGDLDEDEDLDLVRMQDAARNKWRLITYRWRAVFPLQPPLQRSYELVVSVPRTRSSWSVILTPAPQPTSSSQEVLHITIALVTFSLLQYNHQSLQISSIYNALLILYTFIL